MFMQDFYFSEDASMNNDDNQQPIDQATSIFMEVIPQNAKVVTINRASEVSQQQMPGINRLPSNFEQQAGQQHQQ